MSFVTRFLVIALIAVIGIVNTPDIFIYIFRIGFIQAIIGLIQTTLFVISVAAIGAAIYPYIKASKPKAPELKDKWFGRTELRDGQSIPEDSTAINKFEVNVSEEVLQDLRRRLESARFVEPIAGTDFNYGFNANYLKEVIDYWKTQFDWRKQESELNKFNQYTTQINGLNVHFIHVKPSKAVKTVIPLMVIHGWPGSVWEYYQSIPLLIEPTNDIAFEVICPSIPGYGFSEAPHQQGFDLKATAAIFVKLMKRLNHQKFFVHGGDWGTVITKTIAKLYPQNVRGIHTTMGTSVISLRGLPLLKYIFGAYFPSLVLNDPETEYKRIYPFWPQFTFLMRESGYMHIQATKPDTVGAALNDSPVGLAAYILEKYSTWTNSANVNKADGGLTEKFSLDQLLTNVMIYWISNNVASSMRFYKESLGTSLTKLPITVPSAVADFPHELVGSVKSFAQKECPNLVQFTSMPRGGHFGAFEEPKLLTDDIKKFVKTVLRNE